MLAQRQNQHSISPSAIRHTGRYNILRLLFHVICHAAVGSTRPLSGFATLLTEEAPPSTNDPQLYIYLGTALALVLLGGVFAGLTIALMGQDEIYLQVIATSGDGAERKNAAKVLRLLKKGKHWVLVTLLVSNVITNETLPIVLDRSLGGGYAAAITSTVLVIIFGEIVPQSACVRYGLPIGAWTSPFVLAAMWITSPVSWPVAKLLDWILGEDHGTTYKKAGLKTLVTLHQTLGGTSGDRLNEDEVSIISGVLDLKAKSVGSIMTPMSDVFTLSADAVLDEDMMNDIMREGYSRIPIHSPRNESDFVGMLLVKMLITYDPEDGRRVRDFALATLPETMPDTSCLDIINFFQQGKSHMVLVSESPGQSHGALGVVTLEDVIEELIGEEIIDESDVFIDVHKAIRRMTPAPLQRMRLSRVELARDYGTLSSSHDPNVNESAIEDDQPHTNNPRESMFSNGTTKTASTKGPSTLSFEELHKPKSTTFFMRRKSSGEPRSVQMSYATAEMKENLRNLGPSNLAARPRPTRVATVKIKLGLNSNADGASVRTTSPRPHRGSVSSPAPTAAQEGIGKDTLTANHEAADGVHALQQGYGTWDHGVPGKPRIDSRTGSPEVRPRSSPLNGVKTSNDESAIIEADESTALLVDDRDERPRSAPRITEHANQSDSRLLLDNGSTDSRKARQRQQRRASHSTIGSLRDMSASPARSVRGTLYAAARSGSIQEKSVESGNVKKLVLELTSSSEEADESSMQHQNSKQPRSQSRNKSHSRNQSRTHSKTAVPHLDGHGHAQTDGQDTADDSANQSTASGKHKKKRRKSKKKKEGSSNGQANGTMFGTAGEGGRAGAKGSETTPLLLN